MTKHETLRDEDSFTLGRSHHTNTVGDDQLFNSCLLKTIKNNELKGRQRVKRHATKTRSLIEATITQLINTVWNDHLFNSATCKTGNTTPLKGRRKAKRHATKMIAPLEATQTTIHEHCWGCPPLELRYTENSAHRSAQEMTKSQTSRDKDNCTIGIKRSHNSRVLSGMITSLTPLRSKHETPIRSRDQEEPNVT